MVGLSIFKGPVLSIHCLGGGLSTSWSQSNHTVPISCQTKNWDCIGFTWQGFGSGGPAEVASVRTCQKLPLCPIEPMPAGSKMDPQLAKAEPINDSGSASGIIYLRRGKKPCTTETAARERSENM